MINIAICEDEATSLAILQTMLENYCSDHPNMDADIVSFSNPADLMKTLRLGNRFDIYFLDIYMQNTDGIRLAEFIRKLDLKAKLVFTTSSKEHALDAFRVGATQYLLKPINKTDLDNVMDELTTGFDHGAPTVVLNTSMGKVPVQFDEVIYAEYYQHVVTYHLTDGRALCSKSLRVPFSEAVSNLLSNRRFVQPHKSYIVNLHFVAGFTPAKFIMNIKDLSIPISKSFRVATKNAYASFASATSLSSSETQIDLNVE